jgi:NAD(P)-dependent dehydrogenase (short-subunit alcohol dehydrogenase family)
MEATTRGSLDFTGRRVAVAGGSRGIGRAIVLAFAHAGAQVSVCARGKPALDDLAAEVPGSIHGFAADLADDASIKTWVNDAARAMGGIDILINNATGYGMADDEDGWAQSIGVDVMAVVRASRHALPWLRKASSPCIITTASIAALHASPHSAPYAAAKAAVMQYTTTQALSLAADKIRVNAIAPGSIAFADGIWERRERDAPELYARTLGKIPFGRFGRPEEIANVALFLASPLAGWITGQTLVVDGGQILNG